MAAVPASRPKKTRLILFEGPPVAAMLTPVARASGFKDPCARALASDPGIEEPRVTWGAMKVSSEGSREYMAQATRAMAKRLLALRLAISSADETRRH